RGSEGGASSRAGVQDPGGSRRPHRRPPGGGAGRCRARLEGARPPLRRPQGRHRSFERGPAAHRLRPGRCDRVRRPQGLPGLRRRDPGAVRRHLGLGGRAGDADLSRSRRLSPGSRHTGARRSHRAREGHRIAVPFGVESDRERSPFMPETKFRTTPPEPFFAISPERFLQRAKAPARLLHITNGTIAAEILHESGVPGRVTITADVLHEGPTPAGLPPERWRKLRARYLAESGYGGYDECLASLTEWDHVLEEHRTVDEMILWFEHDLFDQLLLIRTLDGLASRDLGLTRLALICIGEHPQVKPFHGLGQLTPEQMAALLPGRRTVTREQITLARHAWRAFCAAE